jgi:hypothetical protein
LVEGGFLGSAWVAARGGVMEVTGRWGCGGGLNWSRGWGWGWRFGRWGWLGRRRCRCGGLRRLGLWGGSALSLVAGEGGKAEKRCDEEGAQETWVRHDRSSGWRNYTGFFPMGLSLRMGYGGFVCQRVGEAARLDLRCVGSGIAVIRIRCVGAASSLFLHPLGRLRVGAAVLG